MLLFLVAAVDLVVAILNRNKPNPPETNPEEPEQPAPEQPEPEEPEPVEPDPTEPRRSIHELNVTVRTSSDTLVHFTDSIQLGDRRRNQLLGKGNQLKEAEIVVYLPALPSGQEKYRNCLTVTDVTVVRFDPHCRSMAICFHSHVLRLGWTDVAGAGRFLFTDLF